MSDALRTGGCQCGAVRYSITGPLGRASICHCRMCQKAFGNAFAPLVTAKGVVWTKGSPKHFRSSNLAVRGFCDQCGTPLLYQADGEAPEIAICTLDDPSGVPPVMQIGLESKLSWCDHIAALPPRSDAEEAKVASFYSRVVSFQHPDREDGQ